MWLDGIGFATPLEDPTKSRIVGKVGYGVVPPGPKAQHSAIFGDGLGVAAFSKKKGAAWFYIQCITNKANQLKHPAERRRLAGAQLAVHERGGDPPVTLRQAVVRLRAGIRARSAAPACR